MAAGAREIAALLPAAAAVRQALPLFPADHALSPAPAFPQLPAPPGKKAAHCGAGEQGVGGKAVAPNGIKQGAYVVGGHAFERGRHAPERKGAERKAQHARLCPHHPGQPEMMSYGSAQFSGEAA